MSVYLSIDLDYWMNHESVDDSDHFFDLVFAHCHALKIPIRLVREHHWLLPHINASKCEDVWNIDYHSDLADRDKHGRIELNCGTWGNHVRFRAKGTYVWCAPDQRCRSNGEGWCHIMRNPFVSDCSGWKRTRSLIGWKRIPWEQVRRVGVAVSPDFFKVAPVEGVLSRFKLLAECHIGDWDRLRARTVRV